MGTVLAVSWLALLDFCMMLLLEKMNRIVRDNREKEMLLQEVRFNELYYSELEKSNLEFAKIRHDMKNRLSAFYHLEACDIEKMREGIQSLYNELDASKPDIVTRNRALNSILKIKFMQAEQEGIRVEHKIVVPDSLNMECGDMGILFGNIMDNAIEACRLCKEKEIELYTELKNNTLIIKVCNTKCKTQIGTIGKTSKKHADGHGIGLKSVRKIVNKYDGTMEMQDYGERFEVKMILYGVEGEGHGACRESRKVD